MLCPGRISASSSQTVRGWLPRDGSWHTSFATFLTVGLSAELCDKKASRTCFQGPFSGVWSLSVTSHPGSDLERTLPAVRLKHLDRVREEHVPKLRQRLT